LTPQQRQQIVLRNRTAKSWVEGSPKVGTQRVRWNVLRTWCIANTWTLNEIWVPSDLTLKQQAFSTINDKISQIRAGEIDLYQSANMMVDYMIERGTSPTQTHHFRIYLSNFFRYTNLHKYDGPFDKEEYDQVVKKVKATKQNKTITFEPEQLVKMLQDPRASAKTKALIELYICAAPRESEAIQVQLSDINFKTNPPEIAFRATSTKTQTERISFLSREATQFIQQYLESRTPRAIQSPWLFPNQTDPTKHIVRASAYRNIINSLKRLGFRKKDVTRYTLSPHKFRTLNLSIAQSHGFPLNWAQYLVGQDTGVSDFYTAKKILAQQWLEKVEPHLNFLGQIQTQIATDQRIEELESELADIKKRLVIPPVANYHPMTLQNMMETLLDPKLAEAYVNAQAIFKRRVATLVASRKVSHGSQHKTIEQPVIGPPNLPSAS